MQAAPRLATLAAALALALFSQPAAAQMPLIDAGNQAMLMHMGDLLEQQTAPDQAPGRNGAGGNRPRPQIDPAAFAACQNKSRAALRPEYERRVAAQGQSAADIWLREAAQAAGRGAARRLAAGQPC